MRDALDRIAAESRVSRGHLVREAVRSVYGPMDSLRMHPTSLKPNLGAHGAPLLQEMASHGE